MKKKSASERGIIQKLNKSTGKMEWYARIVRTDGVGKRREFTAKAESKSHAKRLRDELIALHSQRGGDAIEGSKLLFREVASLFEESKLYKAEYHGEGNARRKIGGVRSLSPSRSYIKVLRQYFGAKLLKNISYADVEEFKRKRLKTPTIQGRSRSISDVNRSLALLKSILKFAKSNRWIQESPFEHGSPLISMADEVRRERTLERDEEAVLLAACIDNRRHLRPIIITALDTAMRRGELLKLTWNDVDFARRRINVIALNTKTARARTVGMSDRVYEELQNLWEHSPKQQNSRVFGIKDNFKRSFVAACKEAKIEDFHFHDLRHTAISRSIAKGLLPMQIMKVSGHTQINTFARYIHAQDDAVDRIAEAFSDFYKQPTNGIRESESVN